MTDLLCFAVVADVHGNALALEAVLADLARRGHPPIINLGDNANGPLEPARAVALLRGCGAIHVRGNGDRMVGEGGTQVTDSATYTRARLDAGDIAWLRALPVVASGDGWFACHGSPASDTEYLLEEVTPDGVRLRTDAAVVARLASVDAAANLILCGHSHQPRVVRLADRRVVVNPGSVGLPAYEDAEPWPHRMETGTPHARYAIVTRASGDWQVELCAVAYDWGAAAAQARAADREDWARALETGRV